MAITTKARVDFAQVVAQGNKEADFKYDALPTTVSTAESITEANLGFCSDIGTGAVDESIEKANTVDATEVLPANDAETTDIMEQSNETMSHDFNVSNTD